MNGGFLRSSWLLVLGAILLLVAAGCGGSDGPDTAIQTVSSLDATVADPCTETDGTSSQCEPRGVSLIPPVLRPYRRWDRVRSQASIDGGRRAGEGIGIGRIVPRASRGSWDNERRLYPM